MYRFAQAICVSAAFIVLTAFCGCGGGGGGGGSTPIIVGPGKSTDLVAFSSKNGSFYQVNLMYGDGSNQHALTTTLTDPFAQVTSLSPQLADGSRWVAFDSMSGNSGNYQIFVVNTASATSMKPITSGVNIDQCPAWSPDGTKIAYLDTNTSSGITSLYYIDVTHIATPGTPKQVINVENGWNVCWVDSTHIACTSTTGSGTDNVYSVNVTQSTAQLQPMTSFTAQNFTVNGLSYSATQGLFVLAYSGTDANGNYVNGQLYTFAYASNPTALSAPLPNDPLNQFDDMYPTWSVDGTKIYYATNAPDTTPVNTNTIYSIYVFTPSAAVSSTNPLRLTSGTADSSFPSTRHRHIH